MHAHLTQRGLGTLDRMHIESPTFSPIKLFGYDPDSVDRAVDWAMDRIRQDDPLEEPEVNALRFPMARRNGYDPKEVDAWFDSLREPIASEVHSGSPDAGRPLPTDPFASSDPFPWLSPSSSSDPFASSASESVPPPSEPAAPPEPDLPPELHGVSDEPVGERGHRSWVQLTALVLIVALLGMFIVSYFL